MYSQTLSRSYSSRRSATVGIGNGNVSNVMRVVPPKERKQRYFDFNHCWAVSRVFDKHRFLAKMIEVAPLDAIWTVQGIRDAQILDTLKPFVVKIEDTGNVVNDEVYHIQLTKPAKLQIISSLADWNLDKNVANQNIFDENTFYFTSYGYLSEDFTLISQVFSTSVLKQMYLDFIIKYYDPEDESRY